MERWRRIRVRDAENHGFHFRALLIQKHSTGELIGVRWLVDPTNNTDGPVLQRLGDREIR